MNLLACTLNYWLVFIIVYVVKIVHKKEEKESTHMLL